ncbi:MAG: EscU/YscU/HrcU family type III secretion system export apparatus switch protein [Leptospiraceae bacterium]|nr:EscU/YscU/HrcU family type III secretion system export apparatus switch protein [Leptospiraceae bacterium]MDW8305708.1 EscU/YscU/HrcU family type III secretion system export apparatus switch protein [Leptospiraceae bacterium]
MNDLGKKILLACALKYHAEKKLPILIARGEGYLAQKIINLAREYNIPVMKEEVEGLVCELQKLPLKKEIPPELYMAVAKIYAYLYLEGKLRTSL